MGVVKRQLAGIGLIGFLVLLGWGLLPDPLFSVLTTGLESTWFPVILIFLYLIRPVFVWPIVAISVLVGYQYGILLGLPIALLGTVFTSLPPFYLGRYTRTTHGLMGTATQTSTAFFDTVGDLRGLVAARLAPTPAEPISIGAGLGSVTLPVFCLGTLIGELPWTIAAVFVGHSLHTVTQSDLALTNPGLLIGGTFAALLLLAGPLYRYIKQTPATSFFPS